MTIGVNDLGRLLTEMVENLDGQDVEDWLEAEDISPLAFSHLIEKMLVSIVGCIQQEDFTPAGAISASVATSFQIGWEAHKEYGHARQ